MMFLCQWKAVELATVLFAGGDRWHIRIAINSGRLPDLDIKFDSVVRAQKSAYMLARTHLQMNEDQDMPAFETLKWRMVFDEQTWIREFYHKLPWPSQRYFSAGQ